MIKPKYYLTLETIQEETELDLAEQEEAVIEEFAPLTYSGMLAGRPEEVYVFIAWCTATNSRQPNSPAPVIKLVDDRKRKNDSKWKRFKRFVSKRILCC